MSLNILELLQLASIMGTTFLALLFLHAVLHKLADMPRLYGFMANYRLLPSSMIQSMAYVLVSMEVICIAMLLTPALNRVGTAMAIGLLLLYAVAMMVNLAKGNALIECGCGGAGVRLSYYLVLRNGLFILLGLPGLLLHTAQLPLASAAVAVASGAILGLMYVIAEQLLSNASRSAIYAAQAS